MSDIHACEEVITVIDDVADKIKQFRADGKVSILEIISLIRLAPEVRDAIADGHLVPDEIATLDHDSMVQLVQDMATTLAKLADAVLS